MPIAKLRKQGRIGAVNRKIRFLFLLLILSFLAAGVSLYTSWFIEKVYHHSPSYYEPKDSDRQKMIEDVGKSVLDY